MNAARIISETGAKRKGHFVLTSGRHAGDYFNKDAIYMHPVQARLLASKIAEEYQDDDVDVVVGPAMGGIILSQLVAYCLAKMTRNNVLSVYAEKDETGKGFVIKRGYDKVIKGKRVLIVEDVITTGGSVKKVVVLVRELGGNVVGVGAICNWGGIIAAQIADPPRLTSLVRTRLESWPEEDCPLCAQGVHIDTDVGKGREYLLKKGGGN